jgi:restriction system protein
MEEYSIPPEYIEQRVWEALLPFEQIESLMSVRVYNSARGPRYEIEVRHNGLLKFQIVRGNDQYAVQQKANDLAARWDEMWEKKKGKREAEIKESIAAEKTEEAKEALEEMSGLLTRGLQVSSRIGWDSVKDRSDYPVPMPIRPAPERPAPPRIRSQAPDPWNKFIFMLSELHLTFIKGIRRNRISAWVLLSILPIVGVALLYYGYAEAEDLALYAGAAIVSVAALLLADLLSFYFWLRWIKHNEVMYAKRITCWELVCKLVMDEYRTTLKQWNEDRETHLMHRNEYNASIDRKQEEYLNGNPEACVEYYKMVLSKSEYPRCCPKDYDLEYISESETLIVDCQLPSPTKIPNIAEVKYIQARDRFEAITIPKTRMDQLYDDFLYQITLRTLHELFEADDAGAVESVVYNGYVRSIDRATGHEVNGCILSVRAGKEEFESINLTDIDPKACFRRLKGVSCSKLHSLAPVAPVMTISREDKRFVSSYNVVDLMNDGENLGAMDWQDFEHLIRELFEKEFAQEGGEVKVTRASRDGGIDAVVFDPDPLRGGKIVIQAKRYTGTVGVSAVRDLYGTLMNEGANKGILVTTSDYGPDAYEFAKGKPLVLLSGGNLLHLLQKHGYKAKIDLKEAIRINAERSSEN